MSRTAVILVNYNNETDTRKCVESLLKTQSSLTIVVVDNESTAPEVKGSSGMPKSVKVIRSSENLGFGRANNLGISWVFQETSCEFVFILNNDTTIQPDTILRLERVLDADLTVGASCPRIVMMDNPELLWYGGGDVNWYKGSAQVPGYRGPANTEQALTVKNVSFASGCAMLIRRSVLQKVGGFDPRFFMYEEDLELCLRILKAGWTIRYVPEALVLHKVQGSHRKNGQKFFPLQDPRNPKHPFFMYHLTKNRLLAMSIHARGWNAVKFWCFFPPFWIAKCISFALHNRWSSVAAVGRGFWDYLTSRRQPFVNKFKEYAPVVIDKTDSNN